MPWSGPSATHARATPGKHQTPARDDADHPHRRPDGPDRGGRLAAADRPDLPPGRRYTFGWGSSSRKLTGPAVAAADLGPIDAVLLSHDHHGDNLDAAGRDLLPAAGVVLTTTAGGGRLGGNARGLQPWATTRLEAPGRPTIQVTPPLAGTARR